MIFFAGNLAGLNAEQHDIAHRLALRPSIAWMADVVQVTAQVVALALIADLIDDRPSRRFARGVFKGRPVEAWGHLRLWRASGGVVERTLRGA